MNEPLFLPSRNLAQPDYNSISMERIIVTQVFIFVNTFIVPQGVILPQNPTCVKRQNVLEYLEFPRRRWITLQAVTRKDHENFDSLLRRFNRKVQQAGTLPLARRKEHFEKELSKTEARTIAIRKKARKDNKAKNLMLKGF